MKNEGEHSEVEEQLAVTAAQLLKTLLQLVRLANVDDAETAAELRALTAARLTVSAARSQIQIELVGNVEGGTKRFYGATFAESEALH